MSSTLIDSQILANRWNLKPRTLQQWRWRGKGPKFIKTGRNVHYRLTDIEAFEDQQCFSSTSAIPHLNSSKKGA